MTIFQTQCQCPAGVEKANDGQSSTGDNTFEEVPKLSPPTTGPLGFTHIEYLQPTPETATTSVPKCMPAPIHHEIQSDDERTKITAGSARVRDTSAQSAHSSIPVQTRLKSGKQTGYMNFNQGLIHLLQKPQIKQMRFKG